jgi:hypothetical protein
MSHSPFTNLGSNQDPDDWHSQALDREIEKQNNKNMQPNTEFKNPFLDVPKEEVTRSTLIVPHKIQAIIKNFEPKDGAIQTTISILLQKLTHELSTSGIETADRNAYHRAVSNCTLTLGGVTTTDTKRSPTAKSPTRSKSPRATKSIS